LSNGLGKKERKVKKIKKLVDRKSKRLLGYSCITLPTNKENILDVLNMGELLFKHYNSPEAQDIYILGLAKGRDDALELVRDIIDEVYKNTGTFDIERYFDTNA